MSFQFHRQVKKAVEDAEHVNGRVTKLAEAVQSLLDLVKTHEERIQKLEEKIRDTRRAVGPNR